TRLLALPILRLASTATTAAAQTALQLRWEFLGDSMIGDWTVSRVRFTLTNRGSKPLPKNGWAIYFSALHTAQPDSTATFQIQDVMADLHRIVPGARFTGLAPRPPVPRPRPAGALPRPLLRGRPAHPPLPPRRSLHRVRQRRYRRGAVERLRRGASRAVGFRRNARDAVHARLGGARHASDRSAAG